MPNSAEVTKINAVEDLRNKILEDLADHVDSYLKNAQLICWNSDGDVNTSLSATVAIKKKDSKGNVTYHMEIDARERIPKPKIKHDLDFDKAKQLVML